MDDLNDKAKLTKPRTHLLRESGRTAILDRVANALSEGGLAMSMSEVSEAVGIGRATLYRYFPNRQALLDSINSRATADLGQLISSTQISGLSTREGLSRIARAVLAKAGVALLLMREKVVVDRVAIEETFIGPLDVMFCDAQKAGEFDRGIPSHSMTILFLGLLRAGIVLVAEGSSTVEESAAQVIKVCFEGFGAEVS